MATAPTVTPPMDARLMNATASLLFTLAVIGGLVVAGWWMMRLPVFSLSGIELTGDTTHSTATGIRSEVLPQIRGNFFTIKLPEVRHAFEAQPWVRKAVVRRVFPNQLAVQIEEQREAAWWGNETGGYRLLNEQGEIFDANPEEATRDNLPELSGPDESAAQVLEMYRRVQPLVKPLQTQGLVMDARGSWVLTLTDGGQIHLGSGSADEIVGRLQQFVQTIRPVVARYGRSVQDVQYADLRYKTGYAIRLKGVGTVDNNQEQGAPAPRKKAKT